MKKLLIALLLAATAATAQFSTGFKGRGGGTGNGVTTLVDTTGNPVPGRIYYVTADSTYYTWGSNGYWKALSPADSTDIYRLISGEIRLTNVADTTGNPAPGYLYFNETDSFYYSWKSGDYWKLVEGDTSCWIVNAWDEIADIPANIDTNGTDDMLAAAFADSFNVHIAYPDSAALADSLKDTWRAEINDSLGTLPALWRADIADSNRWMAGSTVNAIKPRDGKTVEADSIKAANIIATAAVDVQGTLTLSTTPITHVRADTFSTPHYTLPHVDGAKFQRLETDGAGTVSWQYDPVVYSITIDSTSISTTRNIPFFYAAMPMTIDTVIVVGVTTAAAGTFSVVPQIAHDDTMKSAVAANVIDTPSASTSKTVGDRYTSFTDATLAPKEWAWVKFTTVTTAPRAINITVIGRQ